MKDQALEGKVALITGAARRIGAEIARTLHAEGANIAVHYNASEEAAHQLCETLNALRKNSAVPFRADLNDVDSDQMLVGQVIEQWGRIDILVNNASRFYRTSFGEVTEFAWNDLLDSNLKAPFFLAQAAAKHLKKSKGVIVNIADIHGDKPIRDYSVYCISKSGLLMVTKVLARELGPDVRVNTISPGAILWPEGQNELSDVEKNKIIETTHLNRAGSAKDIAGAVLYFVRDAHYVTGQVLNVDGGRSV